MESHVAKVASTTSSSSIGDTFRAETVSYYASQPSHLRSYLLSNDGSAITKALLQWMGSTDLCEINTYPGLSNGLLLLINQVADLDYVHSVHEIAEHNRKTIQIRKWLENYNQHASDGLRPTTTLQVCAIGETYRLGCLLYLHHRVTSIRARISVRTTELDVLFSEPEIVELANRIVTQLEDKLFLASTLR